VGREAMEQRLACVVSSIGELKTKLGQYLAGESGIEGFYRGELKRNKDTLAVFNADADMAPLIDAWLRKGKLSKLLELWVKGLVFDWNGLYGEAKPRRISLPTYPFARERYWVPDTAALSTGEAGPGGFAGEVRLHPLLHRNTSSLAEQRFSSTFTGEEFFLKDHVINGQRVLPGVAYLEMARAAVVEALELSAEAALRVRLQNITWIQPLVLEQEPLELHIALLPQGAGAIDFEVYTRGEGEQEERIHAQGRAVLTPSSAQERPQLDLESLKGHCPEALGAESCYAAFERMGIVYGPAQRALSEVRVGRDEANRPLVVAGLSLPQVVSDTQGQYVLHPSLLDGALQASASLSL
jgi:polyketide synthase PksN